MIEHIATVICKSTSTDKRTNAVSLFNLIQKVIVAPDNQENEINLPLHYEVFSIFSRKELDSPCKGKFRITFLDPNDENPKMIEKEIDLTSSIFYRNIICSEMMKLRGPGKYHFLVELKQEKSQKWTQVADIPLFIEYVKPEEIPPDKILHPF